MNKKSKLLITSLVLCVVVTIGATMAYFFASTNTKINTFTMSKGISIKLAEPAWDNVNYDGSLAGTLEKDLGKTLSQNFVPGREIPKDPSVKNVSEDNNSVWIAIKLEYTVNGEPSDYAALSQFATINWKTGWDVETTSDHTIFYYNTAVSKNDATTVLFDKVIINNDASAYYPFDIKVTAYAVQAEGLDLAAAKSQLAGYAATH